MQYTSFILKDQMYAIPVKWVREIIRLPKVTEVPLTPDYIKGISNLRGEVFPIIDLKKRLGIEGDIPENAKTIVIRKDDDIFGIIVDRTSQVIDVGEKDIEKASTSNEFIENVIRIDDTIYMILEIDKFIEKNREIEGKEKQNRQQRGTLSEKKKEDIVQENYVQLVTFEMGDEIYGFLIKDVQEIIRYREPNEVPNMPDYVKGVIDLRNIILPVVDLRTMLDIPWIAPDEFTKVIVVQTEDAKIGFIVDRIREVLRIGESKIKEPPSIIKARDRNEIKGIVKVENETIMLLDPVVLIPQEVVGLSDTEVEDQSEEGVITQERQYVVFKLGDEHYGVDIEKVKEINRLTNITRVPRSPKFVEGVMNLRGEILPIIDLRKRFELEKAEINDFTRIIVIDINDKRTGFIVDYVEGVEKISDTYIDELTASLEIGETARFINKVARMDDKLILILNIEDVLSKKEEDQLEKVIAKTKKKTQKEGETETKKEKKRPKKLKRAK